MKLVIILCIFFGYVYSAPKPCNELCSQVNNVNTKTLGSSQTYLTHSSLTDQDALRDLQQSLIDQLHKTHQINLESTRPGNWTEHNDYATDNGAGSIHEERGQLVNDGSQMRYYKKNYSVSYGTDLSGVSNRRASLLTNDDLNIHHTIDRTDVQTHEQPAYYKNQNSQVINHSLHAISHGNSARLEDFGEGPNTKIHESSNSRIASNHDDNWTRHNSYVTDGGHGKVYEEEGQYHQGPAKVRYFKKNYTSSFSTNGSNGSGVAMTPITSLPNINSHIDAQVNQMKSELERVNGHIDQQTRHLSTNINNLNSNRAIDVNAQYDYHSRKQIDTNQHVPSVNHGGLTHDIAYGELSSSHNAHDFHTHSNYEPNKVLPIETQYLVPMTQVQSTNTHQIEKQIYIPTLDTDTQINSQLSQQQQHQYQHQQRHNEDTTIRIPIYRRNDGIHISGDSSSVLQHQQLNLNEHRLNQNLYGQSLERIPVQPQIAKHVEQHWSTSEHRSHSMLPQQIMITNPQGLSETQQFGMLGQQQYEPQTHGSFDNVNRDKTNNFIAGGSSSHRQQYETKTHQDNVHSETFKRRHEFVIDCDDKTHINYNSQHGGRYRRSADYSQHNENLTQQNDQILMTKSNLNDQMAKIELEQHDNENVQATQGFHNHDHHHTHQHNRFDDYSQQHSTKLELDSQQSIHGFEDFTHQQSGNLEFNQQHQSPVGQLEFGEQATNYDHHGYSDRYRHHNSRGHANQDSARQPSQNFEDFTQQQSGNLELNQQQQSLQRQLEFGQQVEHEQYDQLRHYNSRGHVNQNSTQQNTQGFKDYTQQHTGNLELDQQHQRSNVGLSYERQPERHNYQEPHDQYRHHDSPGYADQDSTQQSSHGFEDFTQQHTGNLELDYQHIHQPQNGGLEFGQQTEHHGHHNQYRNYGRQKYGSLESGQHDQQQSGIQNYEQQTHGNYYGHQTQRTEDLSQQSQHDQSVIEQSSRNDHFGQQYTDDLTQQTGNIGDLSQKTFGNLELTQPTRYNDDFSRTNEYSHGSFKPAPKPVSRTQKVGNLERGDIAIEPIGVKGGHRRVPGHQEQYNSHYSQPIVEQSEGVVSLEQQIRKDESVNVFQPRILEAYGGNGPYDANHSANIYADVKPNPTATLAPIVDGKDSWDVREPSTNDFFAKSDEAESVKTENTIKFNEGSDTFTTTTAAPGFWKKIGNKITSTYEKAKDKVSDVFG